MCENMNVVRKSHEGAIEDEEFCLISLKKQEYRSVQKYCPVILAPLRDGVTQINGRQFIVSNVQEKQGKVRCDDEVKTSFSPEQNTRVTLPAGCRGDTETHRFRTMPEVTFAAKASTFVWDLTRYKYVSDKEVGLFKDFRPVMDERKEFEIDVQDLLAMDRITSDRAAEREADQDGGWIADIATATAVGVCLLLILCGGCFFWAKHSVLRTTAHLAGQATQAGMTAISDTVKRRLSEARKAALASVRAERRRPDQQDDIDFDALDIEHVAAERREEIDDQAAFSAWSEMEDVQERPFSRRRSFKQYRDAKTERELAKGMSKFGHSKSTGRLDKV
jgi:hypothetical protein